MTRETKEEEIMHLVFYLRGVTQHVTLWKAMTQCQFFKWRRINMERMELVCKMNKKKLQSECDKRGGEKDYVKKTTKEQVVKFLSEEIILIQGGLRDSVLGTMEFTFPEEALATVLSIMNLKYGDYQVKPSFMSSARIKGVRILLGVKKVPKKFYDEAEKIDPCVMFKDMERGMSDLLAAKVSIQLIGYKKEPRVEL